MTLSKSVVLSLVFAVKKLAEKAITSSTYHIYLLLLDMSKAFDTVSHKQTTRRSKRCTKPRRISRDVHPRKECKTKGQI